MIDVAVRGISHMIVAHIALTLTQQLASSIWLTQACAVGDWGGSSWEGRGVDCDGSGCCQGTMHMLQRICVIQAPMYTS